MNTENNPSDIEIAKHILRFRNLPETPSVHGCLRYFEDSVNEAIKISNLCQSTDTSYTHNLLALLRRVHLAQQEYDSSLRIAIDYEIKRHKLHGIL